MMLIDLSMIESVVGVVPITIIEHSFCLEYTCLNSQKWRDFLISFAKKIGKPDPEV